MTPPRRKYEEEAEKNPNMLKMLIGLEIDLLYSETTKQEAEC